jgi:adenine C2-methylase RlmN of 23S rRNA A2503 and tRNA A37
LLLNIVRLESQRGNPTEVAHLQHRNGTQFTLAVSLHAARDPLRDVLVPLNERWPVAEVVDAARDHARVTGRRISYELTLIDGINDTSADADALATLLRGDLCHVNLIPMNPVAHTPWRASPMPRIEAFAARLRQDGIAVTIRRNRGQEKFLPVRSFRKNVSAPNHPSQRTRRRRPADRQLGINPRRKRAREGE